LFLLPFCGEKKLCIYKKTQLPRCDCLFDISNEQKLLRRHRNSKPVCIQPRPSAVNMTLPAFAAELRAAALLMLGADRASVDRYLMPDALTAANPTHGTTIND